MSQFIEECCKHCDTPLGYGDTDDDGKPLCNCDGARVDQLREVLETIAKEKKSLANAVKLARKALKEI